MFKRLLIFFLFSACLHFISNAQNKQRTDSLLNKLKSEKIDSVKIFLLTDLFNEFYYSSDFDKASLYNNQIEDIANKTNNSEWKALSLFNKGIILTDEEKYSEATKIYIESLKINEALGNKRDILYTLSNLGRVFQFLENYSLSTAYYLKTLKIAKEIGDTIEVAAAYNNIGTNFFETKRLKEALEYFMNAIAIYENPKVKAKSSISTNNEIALVYSNVGLVFDEQKQFSRSLEYFFKAQYIYEATSNKALLSQNLSCIATVYTNMNQIEKALSYYHKSITLAEKSNSLQLKSIAYKGISKAYEQIGDYKNALEYNSKYTSVLKDINSSEESRTILDLEKKYQTEKKQQEIERQKAVIEKRTYFIYAISIALVLIALIAVLVIFQMRSISQRKTIELQQKLLRTQMNPHFIFNALASIQGSVLEKNTDEAAEYISNFAALIRLILDCSTENYIPLSNELKILNYYLQLQKLRYNNIFDYTITVDDNISADFVSIPPMLAQPFIENAIEHGIINRCSKGFIDIHFKQEGNSFLFTVDNFCTEKLIEETHNFNKKSEHKPMAVAITKERLYHLNKGQREKIQFEFKDFYDDNTPSIVVKTRLSFKIPYINS